MDLYRPICFYDSVFISTNKNVRAFLFINLKFNEGPQQSSKYTSEVNHLLAPSIEVESWTTSSCLLGRDSVISISKQLIEYADMFNNEELSYKADQSTLN